MTMTLIRTQQPVDFSIDNVFADEKKLKRYFEKCVLLTDIMTEHIPANRSIVCPFHDDHSPSAELFINHDGSQNIFCYTENRMYSSYDYVAIVKGIDPKRFLLTNYSEEDLNKELETVDFNYDYKTSSGSAIKFSEILEESKVLLPDIVSYFDNFYSHGIEVDVK